MSHMETEFFGSLTLKRSVKPVGGLINDIINLLIERHEISPKTQSTDQIVQAVTFYLDPLNDYLNNLTAEQRKDVRNYFGSGGDKRFWRAFQRAIADARPDFTPEGMREFWADEAKA